MNENTVKVQLHRGMEKLKRCFSDYDFTLVLFVLAAGFDYWKVDWGKIFS